MKDKIRVGVIGAGGIGRIHISSYLESGEAEVVAVSDKNTKKLSLCKRDFGIKKGYEDFREMLEKERLDAVSVCTPNFLHAEQAISALDKGYNVLLEKPMAMNSKEALKIVKKVKETGKILMMGMVWRFMPHFSYLKKLAVGGEFGDIYYAEGKYLRRRGIPGLGGWFTTKKMSGGGPLIDLGVHALDCLMWLMDFPKVERVSGFTFQKFGFKAGEGGWPPKEVSILDEKTGTFDVEDFGGGIIHLEKGKVIILQASWASNLFPSNGISIAGEKGGATAPPLKIYKEHFGVQEDILPALSENKHYIEEAKEFIRCVKKGKEPEANAEKGYEVIKILEAIYKSCDAKKEVQL